MQVLGQLTERPGHNTELVHSLNLDEYDAVVIIGGMFTVLVIVVTTWLWLPRKKPHDRHPLWGAGTSLGCHALAIV